jgi:CheY-like chemotaxis protein
MSAAIESTVLLIGDDSRVKPVFSKEAPNVNLCVVHSHEEVRTHPLPHLILLDLDLPARSAFDVLSWLKTEKGYQKIPVIALTSSEDTGIVDRAYQLGASGCLVKSRTPTIFSDEVARGIETYAALLQQAS